MAAPPFRSYLLSNNNDADVIYPVVWDAAGVKILYDGSLTGAEISPGTYFCGVWATTV